MSTNTPVGGYKEALFSPTSVVAVAVLADMRGTYNGPLYVDNVSVKAGAIVLGDITIGDNAVVGAGAVVMKSVPPNCTVVGVPAYVVRRDGVDVREDLV